MIMSADIAQLLMLYNTSKIVGTSAVKLGSTADRGKHKFLAAQPHKSSPAISRPIPFITAGSQLLLGSKHVTLLQDASSQSCHSCMLTGVPFLQLHCGDASLVHLGCKFILLLYSLCRLNLQCFLLQPLNPPEAHILILCFTIPTSSALYGVDPTAKYGIYLVYSSQLTL